MKKILLFVSAVMISSFLNGQKLTVIDDIETENTSLDVQFRHSFDGGILFSILKKFESDYTYFTTDGTVENTKETTVNPGVHSNSNFDGNYDVGDGYIYYMTRINTGEKIYRLSKQTLDIELFTTIDLPSNEYINGIDYYKGYFYYTVEENFYRISLQTKEIELIADLGFYDAKGVKVYKDKIYLLADNNDGFYGLFECTGTAASIKLIKKIKPFQGISDQTIHWFEFKDKLYFTLYFKTDEPGTIYYTDGSENGTGALIDIHHNSFFDFYNVFKIGNLGDKFIFFEHVPNGGLHDCRIYASDGTPQGTSELLPGTILKNRAANIEIVNNQCYFLSDNTLYKTDGTSSGTMQAHSEYIREFNFIGESLYYVSEDALINKVDKSGNSSQIKYNGSDISTYDELFKSGNKLFFTSSINNDRRLIVLEDTLTLASNGQALADIILSPNIIFQYLTFNESQIGHELIVYGSQGIRLMQEPITQSSIDCSKLTSGNYFLILIDKKNSKFYKSSFTKL